MDRNLSFSGNKNMNDDMCVLFRQMSPSLCAEFDWLSQ